MTSGAISSSAISASAYALDPLIPTGLAAGVEATSIFLCILTTIVVGLRIWVRAGYSDAQTRVWGIDDYLLVIGFLPFLPSIIFSVYATHYGVGLHDSDIPSPYYAIRAAEYIIFWELNYFISSTIVKCAIGFACIRIDQRRRIRVPILVNMLVMVTTAILALIFVFANCKPLAATWNPYLGTCQKVITLETVSYIVSSIQMATDWTCAGVPWFIVAKLQMSRRKKISVMMILGLGVLASIATCVRMPYLKYYDTNLYPNEFLYHVGPIMICSNIECSLGIMACSLPPLRKLFKHYYGSSHIPTSNNSQSGGYGAKLDSLTPHGHKYRATARARGRTANAEWDSLDDDNSSRKGIMRRMDVTITTIE
ncbi:hypothetical protein BKA67DRAFT_671367 [Truncatella angustata]|uniref:Rhodopsin domain-containing protein n=1 Tax=Truncatella angustata TaxID=152316 RepID=A0A9P8UB79_9PEZI|nr:uncharacterized protein BKA67DRAFT_671367 [Truncatella angustata]KAH6639995.1 hypothetical protein BKA67DRAFT_671367 [Truncatella angustata]